MSARKAAKPAAKKAVRKAATPEVELKEIAVSRRVPNSKASQKGFIILDDYGDDVFQSVGGPFTTEAKAVKEAKDWGWEPPYYIAEYNLVARCI